jgi:hypothetical protein
MIAASIPNQNKNEAGGAILAEKPDLFEIHKIHAGIKTSTVPGSNMIVLITPQCMFEFPNRLTLDREDGP